MNNSRMRSTAFAITLLFLSTFLLAQSEVVVKAMEDEIERNVENLKLDGYAEPFFIQYQLVDFYAKSFIASEGVLLDHSNDSMRTTSVRLLVGDYEFNDESLDDTENYDSYAEYSPVGDFSGMGTPLGDDYYGIRSDFWKSTESVYRQAAKKFKRMQADLDAMGKKPSDVLHKRFAKVNPVVFVDASAEGKLTQTLGQSIVTELSERLIALNELAQNQVSLSETKIITYMVNTEGSKIVETSIEYQISVSLESQGNLYNGGQMFSKTTEMFEEVSNIDDLYQAIVSKIKEKETSSKPIELGEEYDGPILFIGKAFGTTLSRTQLSELFSASQTVDTTRNFNGYGGMTQSLENRLGERVSSRRLSIWALPTLESFQGERLSGAYRFDREGLKAPDTLLIVENGLLKNLTTERNVIRKDLVPNGTASGPGTLFFKVDFNDSYAELKERLIEMAEDEGLGFAIVAKNGDELRRDINYYRVDLETGEETLIKDVRLSNFSFNKTRKLTGASQELFVFNPGMGRNLSFLGLGISTSSFIYPNFLLVDGLELTYQREFGPQQQESTEFPVPDPRGKK